VLIDDLFIFEVVGQVEFEFGLEVGVESVDERSHVMVLETLDVLKVALT
jgi:hypothetical protein